MNVTALKPIRDRDYPVYKFRELIESIGTDQEVADLIVSHGYEAPSIAVIKGWRSRNSIPSKWLPLLMHRAMKKGDLPSVEKLIKDPFA